MAAIYTVFTSPNHAPIPNHLPTLIVTPHGQPANILYSYLHTNFNAENYLLTPSPQGDLCVAKLFPPPPAATSGKPSASDPGHGSAAARVVRCEASRNLKWSIANTGVMSPIYKLTLPTPESPDLPLFQISKPNPNATHWSMFYFTYAGFALPPKRIEFGKIQKNPATSGGGTRISITGKTPEEKAVWQTLGEGNEDCVEWVVLCAALNLLDDEILKAAEKNGTPVGGPPPVPVNAVPPQAQPGRPAPPPGLRPGMQMGGRGPGPQMPVGQPGQPPQNMPPQNMPPNGFPRQQPGPPPQMMNPGPGPGRFHPQQPPSGHAIPQVFSNQLQRGPPPPQNPGMPGGPGGNPNLRNGPPGGQGRGYTGQYM